MKKEPAGKPLVVPSETDLAWAAGIIDGEGCIMLCFNGAGPNYGKYHQVRLVVTNTNAPMIRRLRVLFGGNLSKCKKAKETYRQKVQWTVSGKLAGECLRSVLPYMVSKQPEARLAIQGAELIRPGGFYRSKAGVGTYEEVSRTRAKLREDIQRLKRTEYTYADFQDFMQGVRTNDPRVGVLTEDS